MWGQASCSSAAAQRSTHARIHAQSTSSLLPCPRSSLLHIGPGCCHALLAATTQWPQQQAMLATATASMHHQPVRGAATLCGSLALRRHPLQAPPASGVSWLGQWPAVMHGVSRSAATSASSSAAAAAAAAAPSAAAATDGTHAHSAGAQATPHHQQLPDSILLVGFHAEEVEAIARSLPALLHALGARLLHHTPHARAAGVDAAQPTDASGGAPVLLCSAPVRSLAASVEQLLLGPGPAREAPQGQQQQQQQQQQRQQAVAGAACSSNVELASGEAAAVVAGRVVLLVGGMAQQLGASLNDELVEWGVAPALVAVYQPKKQHGVPLGHLVANLRAAHARYYDLLQPVQLRQQQQQQEPAGGSGAEHNGVGAASGLSSEDVAALEGSRVVLSAALDAGEVPSMHGQYRRDEGHMVVLDGLVSEQERAELLAWLTDPAHDHSGPPPQDKWEMSCVDRAGDQETWGLQADVLQALQHSPPPAVLALQRRLAALYPEYTLCHMPAAQVSEDALSGEAGADTPLSCFVGNAVMAGDPCHWHVDADPATIPPHSPWVHNFGYYHNREPCRPLFVTVLLYLNPSWAEDYHSETLFLDPEAQMGLFVRPAPGRVVLMDQDMPHRISAPSRQAPGPRYSLVWKMVFMPQDEPLMSGIKGGDAPPQAAAAGEQAQAAAAVGAVQAEAQAPSVLDAELQLQTICRPEWGQPVRIGSANRVCGVKAFARKAPASQYA